MKKKDLKEIDTRLFKTLSKKEIKDLEEKSAALQKSLDRINDCIKDAKDQLH